MPNIRKPLYPVFSPAMKQCAYHILQPPHSPNPTEDLLSSLHLSVALGRTLLFFSFHIFKLGRRSHPFPPRPFPFLFPLHTEPPEPRGLCSPNAASRYHVPSCQPSLTYCCLLDLPWLMWTWKWLQLRTQGAYCPSRGTESIPFCLYLKSQSPNSVSVARLSPPSKFILY